MGSGGADPGSGEKAGTLRVVYTEEKPRTHEGPFLEDERKLLRTIAQQIGFQLTHEELANAWESWESALQLPTAESGRKWKVIIDFLQRADPQLLQRITRRMLNHLRWKGVPGLEAIPGYDRSLDEGTASQDENQPMTVQPLEQAPLPTDHVFRIASDHCSEDEILSSVHGLDQPG